MTTNISTTRTTSADVPISKYENVTNSQTETTKSTSSLGKDEFLKLLVTQLQYQDPLKPMDNTQFVSQMAQFSSLEQMQNLNSSFTATKAMSLVGKYITGQITTDGDTEEVKGEVQSVKLSSGKAYALVDGKEVLVDDISEIQNDALDEANDIIDLSKYTGLIGKNVNSIVKGVKDNEVYKLQGNVYSVSMTSDAPIVVLNGVNTKIDSLVLSEEEKLKVTTIKEYLQNNIDKIVSAIIVSSDGRKTQLSGTIKSVSGDDNNPEVVYDKVAAPVDSIFEIY